MIEESLIVPFHAESLPVAEGPWLVFAPHPDDETFGMGGALALASHAGVETKLVVVTDGALGGAGENLVVTRAQEARAAADILGISGIHFMQQPDRGLQVCQTTVQLAQELIRKLKPRAVFFPGVMELHPDHRACALLVWQALQQMETADVMPIAYEISVHSPINTLVDITSVMEQKEQAMRVYLSQLGEQRYIRLVHAMNTTRALTLGDRVDYAEGFYRFTAEQMQTSLPEWLQQETRRLLEN